VMLGYGYWQRRFGGAASVIGRTITVDSSAREIVGVMPEGFRIVTAFPDVIAPMALDRARQSLPGFGYEAIARLEPGVTIDQASADVARMVPIWMRSWPAAPGVNPNVYEAWRIGPALRPLKNDVVGNAASALWVLMGTIGIVLIIACANVASLLLVRTESRQQELAVRAALGAGRRRIIRGLLVESLLLSLSGTALGLLFARWATDLFLGSINVSIEMPLNFDFHFDWRVFAYAAGISIATGVLMGIVPAFRASKAQVTSVLHDGGHGSSTGAGRQRLRSTLAIAQVAGSLVLLVVAGLLVRSLQRAQDVDLGFDATNLLVARVDPRQVGYTLERSDVFFEELDRKLEALPGVESVAMAFSVPMGYIMDACQVRRATDVVDPNAPQAAVGCNPITDGYFDTMKIPIVNGRAFTERDTRDSPLVVVINETLARQFWPEENPIGRQLHIPRVAGWHSTKV